MKSDSLLFMISFTNKNIL